VIKFRIDYLNFSTVVIKLYKAIKLVEKIFEFDILNKKRMINSEVTWISRVGGVVKSVVGLRSKVKNPAPIPNVA
jgi:hypothetical protein